MTERKPASIRLTAERRLGALISLRVLVSAMALVGGAAFVAGLAPSAGAATATVEQKNRDVTIDAEAGLEGVVPLSRSVPIRAVVTSTRARVVNLEVSWDTGQRSMKVEVGADAPTTVDLSLPVTTSFDLTVTDSKGVSLANKNVQVEADADKTLVGVGPSLWSQGAPRSSPTVGSIQVATLVTLNDDILARPGALDSMSGVVLSAADVDTLEDTTRDMLREWVWSGGDLALDFGPSDQLPVVDLPATGSTTAVGAGWVRFTDGAAAGGQWSSILEPSVIRTVANFNDGFGNFGFGGDFGPARIGSGGLLKVGFIPTWVIVLAVFGTALVAGPIAWFVLHTRRRRRWMWMTAPGISLGVAAVLLVSGQGVFTNAKIGLAGEVSSSPWASTGSIYSGLKQSKQLDLEPGAELLIAQPEAVVTSSGGSRSVRIDLPRNSFGTVGVGPVSLEDGPRIEVVAVATPDGKANVSVTNHSEGTLTKVTISGNSRSREFSDVGPNKTETLPFEMGSDISVFAPMFPDQADFDPDTGQIIRPVIDGLPESRGLVLISGSVKTPVKTSGLAGNGVVGISAVVPVQGNGAVEPAALRIDELGGWSNQQLEQLQANGQMFGDGGMDDFGDPGSGDFAVPNTTAVVGGVGEAPPVGGPEHVRFSFPEGRGAAPCGMHTVAPQLSAWDGTSWVPLDKVGDTYMDDRLKDIQGQPGEIQDWMFPAVEPGGRLYLKIEGREFFGPPALLFDCEPRP